MVKSVLGVNHQGLRDWLFQRMSAVIMVVYFVGLFAFIAMHSNLTYELWYGLFSHMWVKVATILFFLSLLIHAWVGMWTIFTDYIKCSLLALVLNTMVLLALLGFFFAALMILWGI